GDALAQRVRVAARGPAAVLRLLDVAGALGELDFEQRGALAEARQLAGVLAPVGELGLGVGDGLLVALELGLEAFGALDRLLQGLLELGDAARRVSRCGARVGDRAVERGDALTRLPGGGVRLGELALAAGQGGAHRAERAPEPGDPPAPV